MRVWMLAVVVAAGCGGAQQREPAPTDDLELETELEKRDSEVFAEAEPTTTTTTSTSTSTTDTTDTTGVKLEIVDESGTRIDLAVKDADVDDVLRMIAAAAKISVVVADDVDAKVTLEVRNVTWRQAIDVIAQLEGLTVVEDRGVVMVSRPP